MKDIGDHPERAKNLHFSFVVLLRAVRKVERGGDGWQFLSPRATISGLKHPRPRH